MRIYRSAGMRKWDLNTIRGACAWGLPVRIVARSSAKMIAHDRHPSAHIVTIVFFCCRCFFFLCDASVLVFNNTLILIRAFLTFHFFNRFLGVLVFVTLTSAVVLCSHASRGYVTLSNKNIFYRIKIFLSNENIFYEINIYFIEWK